MKLNCAITLFNDQGNRELTPCENSVFIKKILKGKIGSKQDKHTKKLSR